MQLSNRYNRIHSILMAACCYSISLASCLFWKEGRSPLVEKLVAVDSWSDKGKRSAGRVPITASHQHKQIDEMVREGRHGWTVPRIMASVDRVLVVDMSKVGYGVQEASHGVHGMARYAMDHGYCFTFFVTLRKFCR
jgi:hypothetical protein